MQWPIQRILTEAHQPTGWALVHAPIHSPQRMQLLADLRREGTRFVGMSSETTFPRAQPTTPIDYFSLCEAWCTCFRTVDGILPATMPTTRLSLSDFVDPQEVIDVSRSVPSGASFDFLHVTAAEAWKAGAKGWPLARRCLPVLASLGMRGLVVGATTSAVQPTPGLTWRPFLPRAHFLSALARARMLLVTGGADPSPRVLAEAMSLNVPILLNARVLGGWHYLNANTGVFFHDESDVAAGALRCLAAQPWRGRSWFDAHHGPERSGKRLAQLLSRLDPHHDGRRRLRLEGEAAHPEPR